jgi:hypothetical protein
MVRLMTPIRFACTATLPLRPADIVGQILDLDRWTEFTGYGVLPGIRAAEYEVRTPGVVGSRIKVTNTDGSQHFEEIVEWLPDRRVRLRMTGFSPPLCRIATEFVESWEFRPADGGTAVTRSFEMVPKFALARYVLWLISLLLRKAIARHLREMGDPRMRTASNHST